MRKIAVLGAGVIGSTVGGYLKKAGGDVIFIDPFKEHMDAIREKGLTINDNDTGEKVYIPDIPTYYSAEGLEPVDVIIILVKGSITRIALDKAKNLIGPNTYLQSFQNGIGNDLVLNEYTDMKHILVGSLLISGNIPEPGTVNVTKSLASVDAAHAYLYPVEETEDGVDVARYLSELLWDGGQVVCRLAPEIQTFIWNKGLMNIVCNPTCGLTRLNIGNLYNDPDGQHLMRKLAEEAIAVAQAMGIKNVYMEEHLETMAKHVKTPAAGHYPSMAQDMLFRKVPTEIEFLCGAVMKYGKMYNIPTPYNEVTYYYVKTFENNYDKQYKG